MAFRRAAALLTNPLPPPLPPLPDVPPALDPALPVALPPALLPPKAGTSWLAGCGSVNRHQVSTPRAMSPGVARNAKDVRMWFS